MCPVFGGHYIGLDYVHAQYPFFIGWMGGVSAPGNQGRYDDLSLKPYTTEELFALRDFETPNVRASMVVTPTIATGIALCVDDPQNPMNFVLGIVCQSGAGFNVRVMKVVSGIGTQLISSPNITLNGTFELEYASGVIRAYNNGQQIGVDVSASDESIISNTYHGMFSIDETSAIESFSIKSTPSYVLKGSASALFRVVTPGAVLWSTSGTDDHLARPILVDLGDKWAAIYRSSTDHSGNGKFHIRFSNDEGGNWGNEDKTLSEAAVTGAPFMPHAGSTNGGDAMAFKAPNGDLIIHIAETSATGGTYQYRSTDGGETFVDCIVNLLS